jgi:BirA family biotin operon repressor/biotin-[acetyl-CoA-carboxylase] ligase
VAADPGAETRALVAVLEVLAEGRPVAAQELPGGVPDVALAEALRAQGAQRDGADRWCVPGGLDRLRQARTAPGLTVLDAVGSTNGWLLERIEAEGAAQHHDRAVTAELQTAGRGRRGRRWASPYGRNVYLTLARHWRAPLGRTRGLSLAVGVAAAEAIEALTGAALGLKWPNDLFLDERKVGGILVETRAAPDGTAVVVGIGLNVHGLPEPEAERVEQAWTHLSAIVPDVRRDALLLALLPALRAAVAGHEANGLCADVRRAFRARDLTLGRTVRGLAGTRTVEGVGRGIAADGTLAVATDRGLVHLEAGEVSLRLGAAPS